MPAHPQRGPAGEEGERVTPIADMVEQMLADGATPSLVVLAIRAVEIVTLRERDASRFVTLSKPTMAAARAKRYREKLKQNQPAAEANDAAAGDAQIVESERDASRDGVTPRCDLSSLSSSVKGLAEEGSREKKKEAVTQSARGTRMIEGAQISSEDLQFAIDKGMTPDASRALWVEFVDFWIGVPGQRGVKLSWPATWRNRVRAIGQKGGQGTHKCCRKSKSRCSSSSGVRTSRWSI
jgi:hypothetical protein